MPTSCADGLTFLMNSVSEARAALMAQKYQILADVESTSNPTLGYFLGPAIDNAVKNMEAVVGMLGENEDVICGDISGMNIASLLSNYRR